MSAPRPRAHSCSQNLAAVHLLQTSTVNVDGQVLSRFEEGGLQDVAGDACACRGWAGGGGGAEGWAAGAWMKEGREQGPAVLVLVMLQ
jgi:hypothetical protein